MEILYWVIFGLIAGTIANWISPNPQGGIVGSIILGIVGALVGGWIGQMLLGTGVTGFNVMSFFLAVVGSLIVLFVARLFMRNR